MSIQKPDIGFTKIANELREYTAGSREERLSYYQGELIFDTNLGVARNLPKKQIAFSDFVNATQYIATSVEEPRFVWPSPLSPLTLTYSDTRSHEYTFDCKISKPEENAQWGNAIPVETRANLAGNSNDDIDGMIFVSPPKPPSAGSSHQVKITIKIPRNFSGTRYYSVQIHTDYAYPTDLSDPNWKSNPLSQGIATFSSVSASVQVGVRSGGTPDVYLINQTTAITDTEGVAIKYENDYKPEVCSTKRFAAFGFDLVMDGITHRDKVPDGWELVSASLNYRTIYTPYDPGRPQFSPQIPEEVIIDVSGPVTGPDLKSKYRLGQTSRTVCYDTPTGIGATQMRMEVSASATYRNLLEDETETFSDSLTVIGGTHSVRKEFREEVIVPGEAFHTAFYWRYITNNQQTFDQRAVDMGADQIDGVMEHSNFELVAEFNQEAIGKRFNVYIGPGQNGYYISGISTGEFGVPQFSPSVSKEWTVPAKRQVVIGCFIATGTAKQWKGPGSSARAILEYIEDGKSQHAWRGTTGEPAGGIVAVQITDPGFALLSGPNGPKGASYRGKDGYGATFDFQVAEGELRVMKPVLLPGRTGSGRDYKVGETFDIDTVRFAPQHPKSRDAHARITQVTEASTGGDMSPDAAILDVPVFDKPAHLSKNSGLSSKTVIEEGDNITFTVVGENLGPNERTGYWEHSFPDDVILLQSTSFTTEYVGSGTGYRYNGTILTANRPNHYEDVTGQITAVHSDSENIWFTSDVITIKNVHEEPGLPDPEITTPSLSVSVTNRGGAAPGSVAEMTATGHILLRKNGKFTRHQVRTGGFEAGTTTTGTCATDMTGTDWNPRITPGSGTIDSFNVGDVDLWANTVDERPSGSFTRTLTAIGRTFAVSLIGEQLRFREAQITASASWELYNSITKQTITGGSITGFAEIHCGQPDDTPVTSPPPKTIVRQYCEYLLTAEFMGRTGYQITEYSDGTQTKLLNEEECGPAFTTAPPATTAPPTTPPGTTWCLDGNRYASTTSFPFVVLIRANDPTCTDADTTTAPPTTAPPTTAPPTTTVDTTWCGTDGHRYRMGGTFPNLTTVVVRYNDPTCVSFTTAPPTTAPPPTEPTVVRKICVTNPRTGVRTGMQTIIYSDGSRETIRNLAECAPETTTRPPTTTAPPGPEAGTIVPGSESCFLGTKFWQVYTGVGNNTEFKSQANHPDCVVVTTTQPPITTQPPTTTQPPAPTVSFKICVTNPRTGLRTGYQTIIYSDGSRETVYNPTDCSVQNPPPPTTTTSSPPPPTTTRPSPTIRPGFDPVRGTDNRRRDV